MKESEFEREFQLVAQSCGCVWVKIPDPILTAETRFRPERKRPADGVLIMQCGVMLIELKIGSGSAKPHQLEWSGKCRKINPLSYVFIRKRPAGKVKSGCYQIEISDGGKPRLIETIDNLKALICQLQSVLIVNSNSTELQELLKRRYQ